MICTNCHQPLTNFISIHGECLGCTIYRARANELFWENLTYFDYCEFEILPIIEGNVMIVTVKPNTVGDFSKRIKSREITQIAQVL